MVDIRIKPPQSQQKTHKIKNLTNFEKNFRKRLTNKLGMTNLKAVSGS
jgi:hypothetical protein